MPRQWHWVWRYLFAIAVFWATIGISTLQSYYNLKLNLTIPIVLAVVAVAWWGGRGPGVLLAILFQATTIYYVPIPPDSTLAKAAFGWFSIFSLYIFLVWSISGLKRVQHRLASQRDLLQVTLSSIGDGVIATDVEGRVIFMNPIAQGMTGWKEDAAVGRKLEEVFEISSEESGELVENPVERVLRTGAVVGLANHTILTSRDGQRIPIDDSAAPITHDGQIRGVVLVFADVTERKLVEKSRRETEIMHRLVEAQEAERNRIARDLHDHLGQRMTALRMRLEGLTEKAADVPSLSDAIGEVQNAARHIDRDIGFLSWELRPIELDNFGLEDALSSFVREWSSQYGIAAEFHTNNVRLVDDPDSTRAVVETNLYRIVQEALNNVLKHAEAQNVNVLLQHRGNKIILIIEDNGLGFEQEVHITNGEKPSGLGLIGMHERAALLNGTLEIDSRPGKGTTVLATIPIRPHSENVEVPVLPAPNNAAN